MDIELLLDPTAIISVVSGLAVLLGAAGLLLPYLHSDTMDSRLKAVATRRQELRDRQTENRTGGSRLRRSRVGRLARLTEKLKLREALVGDSVRERLVQAGWRSANALYAYTLARLLGPIIFGGMTAFLLFDLDAPRIAGPFKFMILWVVVAFAFYLPTILTTNAIQRRQAEFARAFPNALDLLLICVESGLSIEAAFGRVAQELGTTAPVIAEEFELTTAELAYLLDRRQPLENLLTRVGLPMVKSVCTAIIQADKYGTPLARALDIAAQESRDARMAMAERKASSLPAKLTVPMIVFFLPPLFVVILGPAIIQTLAIR